MLRNAYNVALYLLNKDGALMLKLQHAKMIDTAEPIGAKFNDPDSEVNNQPSIEDMRDVYNMIQLEADKPAETPGAAVAVKGKKKADAAEVDIAFDVGQNVIGRDIEMRLNNHLNQGVFANTIKSSSSIGTYA